MVAFDGNPPPDLPSFPPAWYAKILEFASRGRDSAQFVANVLEGSFSTEAPGPKQRDAQRLVEWLRSLR